MKSILCVSALLITSALNAASVIIVNKSNDPLKADTSILMSFGDPRIPPTWHMHKTDTIQPGGSALLDSGPHDIDTIYLTSQGKRVPFKINIKWWEVLKRVEYRGPNDIKRVF